MNHWVPRTIPKNLKGRGERHVHGTKKLGNFQNKAH